MQQNTKLFHLHGDVTWYSVFDWAVSLRGVLVLGGLFLSGITGKVQKSS